MIAENFRVVLTKNFRIVADVFIKRVFKGNMVTDHDSAPCRTSMYEHTDCRRIQITSVIVFMTV